MTTTTTDNTEITLTPGTNDSAPAAIGYEGVRFNALRHGILSRYVVLSHENGDDYQSLISALFQEHLPAGATEQHLIEELASVIWRKRRVLQAEGATLNKGLKESARSAKTVMPAAVPFAMGLSGEGADLRDLMDLTPTDVENAQRDSQHDLEATQKARAILHKGGTNAYDKALRALRPDSRDAWLDHMEEEEIAADAEGLAAYINDFLYLFCVTQEKEARHHEAIKNQTLGEGLQAYRLEKLSRYETHLDRKFERTLGMLIKLKDLRTVKSG